MSKFIKAKLNVKFALYVVGAPGRVAQFQLLFLYLRNIY